MWLCAYPSFILAEDRVLMAIGSSSELWSFPANSRGLRLNRHGTFKVGRLSKEGASLDVCIPRKGWNPTGPTRFTLQLLPNTETFVIKGEPSTINPADASWIKTHARYVRRGQCRSAGRSRTIDLQG